MRLEIGAVSLPPGIDREKLVGDLRASLGSIGYEIDDVVFLDDTNGFGLIGKNALLTTKDVRRLERIIKDHRLTTGYREGQVIMAVFGE